MKAASLRSELVDYVPSELEEGVIYVSHKYEVAVHLCACGCRGKTVTPFDTGQWQLTVSEGGTVTLNPSILNRTPCKAHYWIRNNHVVWA